MNSPSQNKRSFFRTALIVLSLLVCFFILCLALLPSLISTTWGKDKLTAFVNHQIPGTVAIDTASISWFGPQELHGASLQDLEGNSILSLQKATTDSSLFRILLNSQARHVAIEGLNGVLSTDAYGNTNFQKALDHTCCQASLVKQQPPATVVFKDVNAYISLDTTNGAPLSVQLSGETLQNAQSGTIMIDAQVKGISLAELSNLDQQSLEALRASGHAEFKVNAEVDHLPVALIEQFLVLKNPAYAGLLQNAFGDHLNVTLNQKSDTSQLEFSLKANSPRLSAHVEATVNDVISLKQPLVMQLSLTPELVEKAVLISALNIPWRLQAPTSLNLTIDQLQYPLKDLLKNETFDRLDLTPLTLDALLQLAPASLTAGPEMTIATQELVATLQVKEGRRTDVFTLNGNAAFQGNPFAVHVNTSFLKPKTLHDIDKEWLKFLTLKAEVTAFPMALVDLQLGLDQQLVNTVGNYADIGISLESIQGTSQATPQGQLSSSGASLRIKSEYLDIPSVALTLGKEAFTLTKPAIGKIYFSPSLTSTLLSKTQSAGLRFPKTPSAIIKLNALSLPFKASSPVLLDTAFDADIAFSSFVISQPPSSNDVAFNDVNLHVDAKSLSRINCSLDGVIVPGNQGPIYEGFGKLIKLNASTLVLLNAHFVPKIDSVNAHLVSDLAKLNLKATMREKTIECQFDGTAQLDKHSPPGSFGGSAVIDQVTQQDNIPNLEQAIVHLNIKASQLPTALFNAFLTPHDLSPLIGSFFATDLKAHFPLAQKNVGAIALDISSQLFKGSLHLRLDQGLVVNEPNKPSTFHLTLTPQGYSVLRQQMNQLASDFTLAEPAQITIEAKSLKMELPQDKSQAFPYWKSAIDLKIAIDKLVGVDNQTGQSLQLNNIRGAVLSKDVAKYSDFNIHAEGNSTSQAPMTVSIVGALENGFTDLGAINRRDLSLNFNAKLTKVPIPLLCQFACLDPKMPQKLNALIGPHLDATLKAQLKQMNGPIYADMKGNHGHTVVDGQLTDGILTLNQNFYAELKLTEQLGKQVLQDVIPFLSDILSSDQPLKLAIAKDGFYLPLYDMAPERITISGATLELGKVHFSQNGQLAKVLSLLTTASANEIMVWLTPIYFSLVDGVFSLQRVDMLIADRYPVAAWGNVNIPADRVNMVIGLSGSAISKAFSVPGMKNEYMLQLPLRGNMKNASIDKSKAIARLSALVAQNQGGPQGVVLGTVLDIATGGLTESKPPAPTTNPLPWQSMMEESSTQQPENQAPRNPITEDIQKMIPIEKVGKGAGNLLKKIFR